MEQEGIEMKTITGELRYAESVLETDILKFESGSKLVLAPAVVDDKPVEALRTLTILADAIVIDGSAEITYDLDGDGHLDPDTTPPDTKGAPAPSSDGGSIPGVGSYPHAVDGGHGQPGRTGERGIAGRDAPELEIFVGKVDSRNMTVNFKGQDGGKGGGGGNGGRGGDGQKGAASKTGGSWLGDDCIQEPGRGGNGGKGGDAGDPGRGGYGGNGGIVRVFTSKGSLAFVNSTATQKGWTVIVSGGGGGIAGDPGNPGGGGKGGAQGDSNDPCPKRDEYHGSDGPDGRTMDVIDPDWKKNFKGVDGLNGDWEAHELSGMPKV
jgi:hypothetical protein